MTADATSLDALVSPYGVIARTDPWPRPGRLGVELAVSQVGSAHPRRHLGEGGPVTGSGHAWESPGWARLAAIAEGAERYAAADLLKERRIRATATELGEHCLDPARYPRCSPAELADPDCPVTPFDPDASIRWVRGFDLTASRIVWVPVTLTSYGVRPEGPAERFGARLSTGFAVHSDPVEAVVRGICEVAERDLNALVWLQRLPLPALDPACLTAPAARLVEWCRRRFVDVHLFDATTDLRIPTVYCLLVAPHDRRLARCVAASAGRSLALAADQALREAVRNRFFLLRRDRLPSDPREFRLVEDGALYMGVPERAHAFGFLLEGEGGGGRQAPAHRTAPPAHLTIPDDPDEALSMLVGTLREAGMSAVVVDRTPRELMDVGLVAASVVIPDLQPMSLEPLAQFKAHPRLYEAPVRMGYRALPEEELNPWPQPFP
ncbi:YcaO-like family protein [Spirillospora sp. NBC_00431]